LNAGPSFNQTRRVRSIARNDSSGRRRPIEHQPTAICQLLRWPHDRLPTSASNSIGRSEKSGKNLQFWKIYFVQGRRGGGQCSGKGNRPISLKKRRIRCRNRRNLLLVAQHSLRACKGLAISRQRTGLLHSVPKFYRLSGRPPGLIHLAHLGLHLRQIGPCSPQCADLPV
jgi:hypothetical protein